MLEHPDKPREHTPHDKGTGAACLVLDLVDDGVVDPRVVLHVLAVLLVLRLSSLAGLRRERLRAGT